MLSGPDHESTRSAASAGVAADLSHPTPSPADSRWHAALYDALRGRAEPVLVFPGSTVSAASLWVASRLWVDLFRAHGLSPGDRVVIAAEASPGFAACMVAALWEGLTLAIAPPTADVAPLLERFDARLCLAGAPSPALTADGAGCPVMADGWSPREARLASTPEARVLLRTSGTSGSPAWIALSDENLWSGIDSHRPHLVRREDTMLSVLPWHHAFGLVIDLIPGLLGAGIIVRDASAGRSTESIVRHAADWNATWCSMVPLQAQRLAETPEGLAMLRSLRGGVVGGAPASAALARVLGTTDLRVGYGLTEAAPGVSLGEPGRWIPGALGRPLGCEVRVAGDGRLLVRGPNVCLGAWGEGGLSVLERGRWLDTRDIVRPEGSELIYLGRADHNFKLANGRMVHAARLERDLREALPEIVDAMVFSTDGQRLRVCLVVPEGGAAPEPDAVARVLGPLGDWLGGVTVRADAPEIRTPKGALDRAGLLVAA